MLRALNSSAFTSVTVQSTLLDKRLAERQQSLAIFAHDFELVHESVEFGLASQTDLEKVEDHLVETWREIIELSSPNYSEQ